MTNVIAVTQLRPSLGVSGRDDTLLVADVRHPDALEDLVAENLDEPLLLTCLWRELGQVRRLATWCSVRFPGVQLAVEPVANTALGLSVTSKLASASSDPAAALRTIDTLVGQSWSAVWTPSVASFQYPAPGIAQHLRSRLPGSGFLVQYGEPPSIRTWRSGAMPAAVHIDSAVLFHTAPRRHWVVPQVIRATNPVSVAEHPSLRDQIDAYGSSDAIEFFMVPSLVENDEANPSEEACDACGFVTSRLVCPLCKMSSDPIEDPQPELSRNSA